MTEPVRFSAPFVAMFEALRMGATFARGRRDARAGHVRHLSISSSLVVAQVRAPDEVAACKTRIAVRAFGAAEWARVSDELAAEARYAADLLAGRMPADIEAVFARAGLTLLPLSLGEVAMDCTCQRWPMPCHHLAATCYALARSFDTDPFGVFAWRGQDRDGLLNRLRQLRGVERPRASGSPGTSARPAGAGPDLAGGGLGLAGGGPGLAGGGPGLAGGGPGPADGDAQLAGWGDPADFWGSDLPAPAVPPAVRARPDALLDQLDAPRLDADGRPLVEVLRPAYRAMAPDVS